ncbi:MAG: hypothetical protein WAX14_14950 [Rhodococcus sp. (in: high G+C Gram-positive bacteria)]|uniref:hypothetical protein n=1 Tax=Rhodococcus sp. TaxID=1831 RepID=UPI003BB7BDA1
MVTANVLAQEPTGPEFGKASPVGLALIVILLVATALLVRNMNKRLGRLPETFEPDHPEADQAADEGTDRGATPTSATETASAAAAGTESTSAESTSAETTGLEAKRPEAS